MRSPRPAGASSCVSSAGGLLAGGFAGGPRELRSRAVLTAVLGVHAACRWLRCGQGAAAGHAAACGQGPAQLCNPEGLRQHQLQHDVVRLPAKLSDSTQQRSC